MNEMIRAGRREVGLVAAATEADLGGDRRERLHAAVSRFEAAAKAGDEVGREMADAEIDAILDEGRAARQVGGAEAEPKPGGFDGGVAKRITKPGFIRMQEDHMETPAALFRRALQTSSARGSGRGSMLS